MNSADRQIPSCRYWKSQRVSDREAKIQKKKILEGNVSTFDFCKQGESTNVTGKPKEGTLNKSKLKNPGIWYQGTKLADMNT